MRLYIVLICFIFSVSAYGQTAPNFQNKSLNNESLAFQYYQVKDYENAALFFEKLYSSGKSEVFFEYFIKSLVALKKFDEAQSAIELELEAKPNSIQLLICLGYVLQERGEKKLSEKHYESAIKKIPKDERTVLELGGLFNRLELFDYSIKTFKEGRRLLGDSRKFTFELISLYRYRQEKDPLVQEYLIVLEDTPEMLPAAQDAFAYVFTEPGDFGILLNIVEKSISKKPVKEVFQELLIWTLLQKKDFDRALKLAISYDEKTEGDGTTVFNTALKLTSLKAYKNSIMAFNYLLNRGRDNPYYLRTRLEMVVVQHLDFIANAHSREKVEELINQYASIITEFGENLTTLTPSKRMAQLYAYHLGNTAKAIEIYERTLRFARLPQSEASNIKLELADIYLLNNEPWEAFLKYEQIARDFEGTTNANEANFRSARVSYFQGDFPFALSKVNLLKTSTSQLIANDALNLSLLISENSNSQKDSIALKMYAEAEMYLFLKKPDQSLSQLEKIKDIYPENSLEDDILILQAKIFIEKSNFSRAALLLEELLSKHTNSLWADDALFELGNIYENHLSNLPKAMQYYEKLVVDKSDSLHSAEARIRYRKLRGDKI